MSHQKSDPVTKGLKIEAGHLLKDFKRPERGQTLQAAERLLQHPRLNGFGPAEALLESNMDQVRRKHALDVVALELGFTGWRDFCDTRERWEGPAVEVWKM